VRGFSEASKECYETKIFKAIVGSSGWGELLVRRRCFGFGAGLSRRGVASTGSRASAAWPAITAAWRGLTAA